MTFQPKLTVEQVARAARMRADGWSWRDLGQHFGVAESTMRIRVGRLNFETAGARAARAMNVPNDTRDLTARICGDPLPGRSALDRRNAVA